MSTKSRSFTVQVNYLSGSPVTGSFKITVRKAVGIATKTLKAGTHGVALSRTLKASGGKAPYSWSLVQGSSLPPGLSLSSAGAITGVVDPTAIGLYNFTVQVTDPLNGTFQKSLSLTIK